MRNLNKGDIFVDVGANIGYYTLLASKLVGPSGIVICIEPVPETFKVLLKNIKANNIRNVMVISKAAWSEHTRLKVFIPQGWYGLASVFRSSRENKSIEVKAIPLDMVLEKYKKIKLVKIDVEGAEYYVLKGMRSALGKVQYIILELSHECDKVVQLLYQHGFRVRKLRFTSYILAYK